MHPVLADLMRVAEFAARGKRRRQDVARFLLDPTPPLQALARELSERSYNPGKARSFVVFEPKRRVISALPFRDRVVQHWLVEQTAPALER